MSGLLDITPTPNGVSFPVRATPRARESTVVGVQEGVLVVRVAAAPVEGKANDAVRACIAQWLGVRAAAVQISSGDRARRKRVEVRGITRDAVLCALFEGESPAPAPKGV